MFTHFKSGCTLLALTCLALGSLPDLASAITAEVAKKCNALTAKQFPPREPGNPAAGSAKGSGRDQRAYFSKCVANNGNMDDNAGQMTFRAILQRDDGREAYDLGGRARAPCLPWRRNP